MSVWRSVLRWPLMPLGAVALASCTHLGPAHVPQSMACPGGGLVSNPWAAAPGLGGTGQVAQEPGVGGTGIRVAEPGGLGGTGVVGVVTGFSSVCVNGLKIEAAPETPVQSWAGATTIAGLQVGDLVGLVAVPTPGGGLATGQMVLLDRLVGPVQTVDLERAQLRVMGELVQVSAPADLQGLQAGDWVRVAAQDHSAGVWASRVQRVRESTALARGPLVEKDGRWYVGAVPLSKPTDQAAVGQEVVVRGMWAGGALAVSDAEVQPTSGAVNGAARVVLQGFVQATRSNGMDMGYASVEWSPGIESVGGRLSQLLPGQLVVVSGRWGPDRRVLADRIEWRRLGGRGTTAPSDDNARGRSGDDGASGGGDSSGQGRGRGRGRGRSGG